MAQKHQRVMDTARRKLNPGGGQTPHPSPQMNPDYPRPRSKKESRNA